MVCGYTIDVPIASSLAVPSFILNRAYLSSTIFHD